MQKLDFKTDQMPFFVNGDRVKDALEVIEKNKNDLTEYCNFHPKAKEIIKRKEQSVANFSAEAVSFLSLDNNTEIDLIPSINKTPEELERDKENIAKARNYLEACKYIYKKAIDPSYPEVDADLLIKAHAVMQIETEKGNLVRADKFRDEFAPDIEMRNACFDPVPGELVEPRIMRLFKLYTNDWYKDNPIVRGAKFVVEYFRIQPHMDGNKRTALMAFNFMLVKNGYPSIFFEKEEVPVLIDALDNSIVTRDVSDLTLLFCNKIHSKQKEYVKELQTYRITHMLSENDL